MLPQPHFEEQGWSLRSGLGEAAGESQAGSLFCLAEASFTLESKCSSTESMREHFLIPSLPKQAEGGCRER